MSPSSSLSVILLSLSCVHSLALPKLHPASPPVAPAIPDSGNAVSVSPALISFSLEGDAWPDWAAVAPTYSQRNNFFYNALKNLHDRTGSWPDIRVGANSEDRTSYDEKIKIIQKTPVPPTSSLPYPEAENITVGPGFYALSKFLPSGTSMTWGFNFGYADIDLATVELEAILNAFNTDIAHGGVQGSGVTLELVELGNEPDLYYHNGHRDKDYDEDDYVSEWRQYIDSLLNSTSLSSSDPSTPKIQALSFGHSDFGQGNKFSPQRAFDDGLLDGDIGQHIAVISQHHYSGGCCTARIQDLMDKSFIRGNLSQFENDIAAVQGQGLHYYFGETNTYFNHGVPKVSDAGGAAVWLADYTLYGATLGIEKMYYHEGVGYKYNLIQPVALTRSIDDGKPLPAPVPAHVQAPYYGALAVNEFLSTSSDRQVVELDFSDTDNLSGFALYINGGQQLSKIILFNHDAYLSSSHSPRPSVDVSLALIAPGSTVSIKRLAIPFADVQTGLTWAGQSFDKGVATGKVVVSQQSTINPITVSATEVVLVEL